MNERSEQTTLPNAPVHAVVNRRFLIAEYCDANFFMGWHFYLRDHKRKQKRNDDGSWGWIRGLRRPFARRQIQPVLDELGIEIRGDGTTDDDGIAEFARRFPMRSTVGGKRRGCIEVEVDEYGTARLPSD